MLLASTTPGRWWVFSYSEEGFYEYHAFITGPNGMGMKTCGTLGGFQTWANGINDAGQVVGWTSTAKSV